MKKIIKIIMVVTVLFAVAELFPVFTGAEDMVLEKGADGSFAVIVKKEAGSIPALPEGIVLDEKTILGLFRGDIPVYTHETRGEKVVQLFPLPVSEETVTGYNVRYNRREGWKIDRLPPKQERKIDFSMVFILAVIFFGLLFVSIKSIKKGDVKHLLVFYMLLAVAAVAFAVAAASATAFANTAAATTTALFVVAASIVTAAAIITAGAITAGATALLVVFVTVIIIVFAAVEGSTIMIWHYLLFIIGAESVSFLIASVIINRGKRQKMVKAA